MIARKSEFQTPGEGSHEVLPPLRRSLPLVLASPHSGRDYPQDFLEASRLDALTLRRSEDSFVDEIFMAAPALGAPLIRALFPRAYVDPNREPYELDPAMFLDELPDYANTRSPRVAAGLGTIARVVANGADIYREKLVFADAVRRIRDHYWPYHRALQALVEETHRLFGFCLLLDCHSMPSSTAVAGGDSQAKRSIDIVLGNCHGTSCAPEVIHLAAEVLTELGYSVARNSPYSGGFVTRHYGRPSEGFHSLQIEINRALYMDEARIERAAGLARMKQDMTALVSALGALGSGDLMPLAAE